MSDMMGGKEMSVSQRQIYILSLLSENPQGYQVEEIRQRLLNWNIEVSKRTIMRDIDELSLNYGIGEDERGGKTYYFADKYTLKNVDFTIEDLASLAFAKEMLKEYSHLSMGKHAITFIDRMVEQSTSLNRLQFEMLGKHVKQMDTVGISKGVVDEKIEKSIQTAIDNQNKIKIDYYSFSSDSSTERIVHPYRLLLIDANLCLEGYCELRKEIRRFRLSRMQSLVMLDEKFENTEMQALQENDSLSRLRGGRVEELSLLFQGDAIRYVKEYEANKSEKMQEDSEGLHFYAQTAITPDVIRWVRGFGADVKVQKPEWLATQLLEEAKKMLG
ncbi:MAG: WYL domain-containing protein [Eubacteriales bacterium]|nr:WYL domain-containing protein [Eubacteriales bacterium]